MPMGYNINLRSKSDKKNNNHRTERILNVSPFCEKVDMSKTNE